MDPTIIKGLIGVGIATLFAVATTYLRIRRAHGRFKRDLESLGARFVDGGAALPVAPSPMLIAGQKPPRWSASLQRDTTVIGAYPLSNNFLVITWRCSADGRGRFIMYTEDVGSALHEDLEPMDLEGAFVYADRRSGAEEWLRGEGAPFLEHFCMRTADRRGWTLLYDEGACYLVRYLAQESLAVLLELGGELDLKLRNPGADAKEESWSRS